MPKTKHNKQLYIKFQNIQKKNRSDDQVNNNISYTV
jgi:hypothetical protein